MWGFYRGSLLFLFIPTVFFCADSSVQLMGLLQEHGAQLHPRCTQELYKKRSAGFALGDQLKSLMGFSKKKPKKDIESVVESSGQNKKQELFFDENDHQGLSALLRVLILFNNSQKCFLDDQQESLSVLQKKGLISEQLVSGLDGKIAQVRENQKSWIPSTTREILATVRQGTGSVLEVIAIVGLLILARSLKVI